MKYVIRIIGPEDRYQYFTGRDTWSWSFRESEAKVYDSLKEAEQDAPFFWCSIVEAQPDYAA